MKEKTVLKITLGFLAVMLLGTSAMLVNAFTTNGTENFISSIRVADNGELSEAQEVAQLAPLAKITADDAKAIATGAVDTKIGEPTAVQLENENGNVVYAVEFNNNAVETDVKIDAGNGDVLKVEKGTEDNKGEKESAVDFEQDGIDHQFEGEHED